RPLLHLRRSRARRTRARLPCRRGGRRVRRLHRNAAELLHDSARRRIGAAIQSFDIVSEVNKVELKNAVDQADKEVTTRFDFKGSDARIEQSDTESTLFADDEFKLDQIYDVLSSKMAKRNVDVRSIKKGNVEKVGGDKVKQAITVRTGVDQ